MNEIREHLKNLDKVLFNKFRFAIVTYLYIFGAKSPSEIAEFLETKIQNVETHLRILEKEGYVK